MKVLQINSVCDFGSTGRVVRDIADMLCNRGYDAYVAYGHGSTTFPKAMRIGGKFENHIHNLFYSRILGLHGYGTKRGTRKLLKWISCIKPDIIHLHNLHANYVNYPMLFNYIIDNNIPVVFTLHDCFNFTGKCSHYTSVGCYKWQSECFNCPLYRKTAAPSFLFDNSNKIFKEKKCFYSKISKLTVVTVSKWLKNEAQRSILTGNGHEIINIYNWIDRKRFSVASNNQVSEFYNKYNLDTSLKYLISVSQCWDHKTSRYIDAIKLAQSLPKDYKLILIGNKRKGTVIPKDIIHIPYISSSEELSSAYTMCEAYVHLSVEDTFGKVIAEAMSCGAVTITFNSTACGEIPGPYGIVVPPHDIESIIRCLSKIPVLKTRHEDILKYVFDNYDYQKNMESYLSIYLNLLEKTNDKTIDNNSNVSFDK